MNARRLAVPLIAALLLGACSDQGGPATPGAATVAAPEPPTSVADAPAPIEPATPPVAAPGTAVTGDPASAPAATGARELEWDDLIPDDFRPDKLMAEYQVDDLEDDDPRAAELMTKLKALWDQAPVREDLDGSEVRLPGFVVPVEADDREATGFLLVPYYGACVHVPPPPANQTVYVLTEAGKGTKPALFDVVWVTGNMSVKRIENDTAEAGYTLYATEVAPYE